MHFSIITVTYNNYQGLLSTARSVIDQESSDYEWIVVDGASKDRTLSYLNALMLPNLTVISESDDGIFDAMNKGIALAKNRYCIFMNAGDTFAEPTTLSGVASLLSERDDEPGLVYGDSCEVAGHRSWLKPARSPFFNFYSMFTHHQSIFYRTDLIQKGYDCSYRYSADWALTTDILHLNATAFVKYPGVICNFERGGISQRDDQRCTIDREHWRVLRESSRLGVVPALVLWTIKTRINMLRKCFPRVYDIVRY